MLLQGCYEHGGSFEDGITVLCLNCGGHLSLYKPYALVFAVYTSVQFSSVAQSCLTLCDPMNCNMPGLPVHHQLLELTQIQVQ